MIELPQSVANMEVIMNRIENRSEELVELGVASIETKGLPVQALIDSKGDHVAGGMSHD